MGVLLANTRLGIRRRPMPTADPLGDRVQGDPGPLEGPWPGRVKENADGRWVLGVDPAAWPVHRHDLIAEPEGRVFVALTAQLARNTLDPTVDYVRVEAVEQVDGATEPGGPEFAGRS